MTGISIYQRVSRRFNFRYVGLLIDFGISILKPLEPHFEIIARLNCVYLCVLSFLHCIMMNDGKFVDV